MASPSDQLAKLKAGLPKIPDTKLASTHIVDDDRHYVAFKAVDKSQRRCEFCPSNAAAERVSYGYLHRIVENRPFYTQIALVYQFMVIVIEGKNLHPIADALDREVCENIWAFDDRFWDVPPKDSKEPFVSSIKCHVEKLPGLKALEDMDHYHTKVEEPSTH